MVPKVILELFTKKSRKSSCTVYVYQYPEKQRQFFLPDNLVLPQSISKWIWANFSWICRNVEFVGFLRPTSKKCGIKTKHKFDRVVGSYKSISLSFDGNWINCWRYIFVPPALWLNILSNTFDNLISKVWEIYP